MKKILVPTDLSEHSQHALDVAIQISQKSELEIILLNVIDLEKFYTTAEDGTYINASQDEGYKQHLSDQANKRLSEILDQVASDRILARVETGDLIEQLSKCVTQESIDLVIIGAHGTSIYEEMLFGSNANHIMRALKCPVLTIRDQVKDFKVDSMVFATSLRDNLDYALPQIRAIQQLFGSVIHLVYINTPVDFFNQRKINEMRDNFLAKHPLNSYTFTIYNDYTIETGIAHFSDDVDADIVALAAHQVDDMLDYILSTHTSDVIIDEAKRPVLAFSI
ncbi:MAG: universal stress protein [Bacteroidia bacterium]|nr:universal stress protein [Bacteroidia bacterium]